MSKTCDALRRRKMGPPDIADRFQLFIRILKAIDPARACSETFIAPGKMGRMTMLVEHLIDVARDILGVDEENR